MLDVSEHESNSFLSFMECNALYIVSSLVEITMSDEENEDTGTES